MCRHGVPDRAGGQLGHTHLQLASGQHLVDDHLVDVALVRHLQRSHVGHDGILLRNLAAGIFFVSRRRVEIELGRLRSIVAGEGHVAVAAADIEGLLEVEVELLVADAYRSGATHVKDAHLATCGEERGAQRVDGLQGEHLADGHGTAHHHTVVHRVDHVHLVLCKDALDEEVAAYSLCVITLGILGMRSIADFVICLHDSSF